MYRKLIVGFDTGDTITYDLDTGKVHSFPCFGGVEPAVISTGRISHSYLLWFKQGKLHNEFGPAVKHHLTYEEYWLDGVQVSKEFWEKITGRKLNEEI